MRQRRLFVVYFLLILWIFTPLRRGMDCCAEMLSIRRHDASDFMTAWSPGSSNAAAENQLTTLFAWVYRRDNSTDPPVLRRLNRLEKLPETSWGALPEGSEHSNIAAAHGKLWIFARNEKGWRLFSADMNSGSAQWRPDGSIIQENIECFFLDDNADPLMILEKEGKWYVCPGRFTGGGEALLWDAMREISLFEKNQLTSKTQKENAERGMVDEFDLRSQAILLAFSCQENQWNAVKIRYRISPGKTQTYGPWSEPLPDSVIQLNQRGRYFQYQIFSLPISEKEKFSLPDLELIYTLDESDPQDEVKTAQSKNHPGKGGSSANASLGTLAGLSGPAAEAGAADVAVSENAGEGITNSNSGSAKSNTPNSPRKTGDADSSDVGENNPQNQTAADSTDQKENPSPSESGRQEHPEKASSPASNDSTPPNDDSPPKNENKQNTEDEPAKQSENGASPQKPSNEPAAAGESPETSPENEPADPQSHPDADPGRPESSPGADPGRPMSSPSTNALYSPQNQPLSQKNPPNSSVADHEEKDSERETNIESGLNNQKDKESSAPAADSRSNAGKSKKDTAEHEKTTPSSGMDKFREPAGDAITHNPTPTKTNGDRPPRTPPPASLSTPSTLAGIAAAPPPDDKKKNSSEKETGDSRDGFENSALQPSQSGDFSNSPGAPSNSRPAAFPLYGKADVDVSRVKPATQEISGAVQKNSESLEGVWKERSNSSWLLLILALFAASYAAYRLMRHTRLRSAHVEPEVQHEDWREGWIEERQERSGVWETVLHFHPEVKAANLSGGVLLLMNQNHLVKKASLPDLGFPKPAEEQKDPTEFIAHLKEPIDSVQMTIFRNHFFVFGKDSQGRDKALQIALPAGAKRVKGKKIFHPTELNSVRSIKADGDILWALSETPNGLRVLAASIGYLKGRTWREEIPGALDQGEITALSSGEETMIAGIPGKDRDHLWIFQQEKTRQGRWRALVKIRSYPKNILLHTAKNRCVLIESTKDGGSIGIHLFPRDERGRFSTRVENHAPAPHAGEWFDLEIAGGCLYLLGRETSADLDPNAGRFCLLAARLADLFHEHEPESK